MKSKRKQIEGKVGVFALAKVQRWVQKRSPEAAERLGAKLGRLMLFVSKKHRERAASNVALAFPEKPAAEREQIARRCLEHFGIVGADFLRLPQYSDQEIEQSLVECDMRAIDEGLSLGKGVLFITGHFGNWERMARVISQRGMKLTVVARDADDQGVNGIMNAVRTEAGTRVIPRGNAARPIIEALRANEIVGILPDQNSDEVFIPFFGHPAGTVLGPGVIHSRTGAAVVGAYCARVGPNQYKIKCQRIEPLADQEAKGEGLMRAIMNWLEGAIREHPEQYLWFHDRWRNARKRGLL